MYYVYLSLCLSVILVILMTLPPVTISQSCQPMAKGLKGYCFIISTFHCPTQKFEDCASKKPNGIDFKSIKEQCDASTGMQVPSLLGYIKQACKKSVDLLSNDPYFCCFASVIANNENLNSFGKQALKCLGLLTNCSRGTKLA